MMPGHKIPAFTNDPTNPEAVDSPWSDYVCFGESGDFVWFETWNFGDEKHTQFMNPGCRRTMFLTLHKCRVYVF